MSVAPMLETRFSIDRNRIFSFVTFPIGRRRRREEETKRVGLTVNRYLWPTKYRCSTTISRSTCSPRASSGMVASCREFYAWYKPTTCERTCAFTSVKWENSPSLYTLLINYVFRKNGIARVCKLYFRKINFDRPIGNKSYDYNPENNGKKWV